MKLYWVRYSDGKISKHLLLLPLGSGDGKLYCLDADALPDDEKEFMRNKSDYFTRIGLEATIAALKEAKPSIMKSFRTIFQNRITILKEYDVKPSGKPSAEPSQPESTA